MLEWEENIFLGLKALYRRVFVRPEEARRAAVRATLAERRHTLTLLGQMIAGKCLSIFETDDPHLCDEDHIFLPREFSAARSADANHEFYTLKTVLAALALREGLTAGQEALLSDLPERHAADLPHLQQRLDLLSEALPDGTPLWPMFGSLRCRSGDSSLMAAEAPNEADPGASEVTEISGQGQTDVTVTPAPEDDGDGADLPTHTFEKVETLEEFNGQSRKSDEADELKDHEEALRSLKMKRLIRSPERPSSIYRSDVLLDGIGFELNDETPCSGIPYPEWDFRKRRHKEAWCNVQVRRGASPDSAWMRRMAGEHRGLIARLKRQFAALASEWLRHKRQVAGPEFDLDALVGFQTDLRSGHTPSEAIYVETKRCLHDLALIVLLDKSYSTASYLENRRVLDLILATVFCVGEVLADYTQEFAVAGFASNTRRSCEFFLAKDFSDSWILSRSSLGSMEPLGYTRIGPALRHAHELLHRRKASRKMVLLITDGKPCDYDAYEGSYGIHDIKKAIETGQQYGIQTHALAVEKTARDYFPRMFSGGHYDIVTKPDSLARVMTSLCARLAAK